MSDGLGLTVIMYAVGLAAVCATSGLTGHLRPRPVSPALVILQVSVAVQALLDVVDLTRGRHGVDLATHVGYLATSLIILPVVAAAVRLDAGRWGSAALAFGCLLVAVVSLRLHQTSGIAGV